VVESALARAAKVAGIDQAPSQMTATTDRLELGGVDFPTLAGQKGR